MTHPSTLTERRVGSCGIPRRPEFGEDRKRVLAKSRAHLVAECHQAPSGWLRLVIERALPRLSAESCIFYRFHVLNAVFPISYRLLLYSLISARS